MTVRAAALAPWLALTLALGVPGAPGLGDATPYADGPYAGRLCPTAGVGASSCVIHRDARAALQGIDHRADARADGATCEQQGDLWVCFGVTTVLAQRGGTTYGDTFLTSRDVEALGAELVQHELEHVRQWRLFGPSFTVLYLREGADACTNYFEEQAGLDAGGYDCA